MFRSALCAVLAIGIVVNVAHAQSPPCKTQITGMTPAVGTTGTTAAVPKTTPKPAPKATPKPERGAVAAAPKPTCTTFDMTKQSRQLCVAQQVSMPGMAAAVLVPKSQADLQKVGTAACKLLGPQFVTAAPSRLIWSIKKTKCFNGATTVESGLAWSELVCCPTGADSALQLPGTSLARPRGARDGRQRGPEGRLRSEQRDNFRDFDRATRGSP